MCFVVITNYSPIPIDYMVSEVENQHGPFTTTNTNVLDKQRRRKFQIWFQKF